MSRVLVAAMVVAIVALPACGRELPPPGEVVLFVDTDALVARAIGRDDPLAFAPQIDRVRFDLPAQNLSRVFEIDDTKVREQAVSFGVLGEPGATPVVRVRLYRADRAPTDEPPGGVALDRYVQLPPIPGDGVVEAHVVLAGDRFGLPEGTATAPIPADPGRPPPSRVGTWHGGRHVGCAAPPRPEEACIPSTSFFFGDPQLRGRTLVSDIADERVVYLSPFYLDVHEVTVAELRAKLPAEPPIVYDAAKTNEDAGYCTYTQMPGSFEALPVNCISWVSARAYCLSLGKELPTEAQFEAVASGLGAEHAFPWGDDEADCNGSVWGRGGTGLYALGSPACRVGRPSLPARPASSTRDTVDILSRGGAGGPVTDLGGNVSEWMLDAWSDAGGFWSAPGPRVDPVAPESPSSVVRSVRGGAFPYTMLTNRAAFRFRSELGAGHGDTGFRCARRADPAGSP